jgi:hypothetical protein
VLDFFHLAALFPLRRFDSVSEYAHAQLKGRTSSASVKLKTRHSDAENLKKRFMRR